MDLKKRVGQRIKAYRKARGISQELLAERIGRSKDAVSRIERGSNLPNLITLLDIAAILDTSLSHLVDETLTAQKSEKREALIAQALAKLSQLKTGELEKAVRVLDAL